MALYKRTLQTALWQEEIVVLDSKLCHVTALFSFVCLQCSHVSLMSTLSHLNASNKTWGRPKVCWTTGEEKKRWNPSLSSVVGHDFLWGLICCMCFGLTGTVSEHNGEHWACRGKYYELSSCAQIIIGLHFFYKGLFPHWEHLIERNILVSIACTISANITKHHFVLSMMWRLHLYGNTYTHTYFTLSTLKHLQNCSGK